MYTCGPTVYSHAHIGNFRAYLFEDLLQRHLELRGFEVRRVMNITDVDDKTIRGSGQPAFRWRNSPRRSSRRSSRISNLADQARRFLSGSDGPAPHRRR